MSPVDRLLVAAAKTIMRGWCRGSMAVDDKGYLVSSDSTRAVAYCIMGAVSHNSIGLCDNPYAKVSGLLESKGAPHSMVTFNDHHATCPEQVAQLLCEAAGL